MLFALLGPPVSWSLHFGSIYLAVAAACAAGSDDVFLPVAVATLVAGAICVAAGSVARRQRIARQSPDGGGSRRLFLTMGLIGAGFFLLLIVLEALPPLFLPVCPPGES